MTTKDMEVMRNRLSRYTQLGITVAIVGLLSGCQTSNWSSFGWPGTSWFSSAKPTTSEYVTPDKPAETITSLPVDQAQKYAGQQETPLPVDNVGALNTQQGLFPTTNQGSSEYLSPAALQQEDPYPIKQSHTGLIDESRSSQLLPPVSNPPAANNYNLPIDPVPTGTTPTGSSENNYNQGYYNYKQTEGGQFASPPPLDNDTYPAIIDSNTLPPVKPEPVFTTTGQFPSAVGTEIETLPPTAQPVPPAGTYRPGSTSIGN
jgi:hypothetical protein